MGVSVNEHGFEGLADHPVRGNGLVLNKPTLEDIMYFHTKGEQHGH